MSPRKLKATPFSTMTIRRVRWLWTNLYKLRGLGLPAGWEGLGKSLITCWIAAQITKGTLPGELKGKPADVIVVASEDDFEDTIAPRMMAADADLDRVHRVNVETAAEYDLQLSLPEDIHSLGELVKELGVKLVILDPIISRLADSLDTHKDSHVRKALEPLVALTHAADCTMIGIIHLSKSQTDNPLDAVMGSKAFTAVARNVGLVAEDSDGSTLLTFPKNNNALPQPSMVYTIASVTVGSDPYDGSDIDAPFIVWGGTSDRTAQDIFEEKADASNPKLASMSSQAQALLEAQLADGPKPVKELVKVAASRNISEATLKKAKRRLRVDSTKMDGFEGYWV